MKYNRKTKIPWRYFIEISYLRNKYLCGNAEIICEETLGEKEIDTLD